MKQCKDIFPRNFSRQKKTPVENSVELELYTDVIENTGKLIPHSLAF